MSAVLISSKYVYINVTMRPKLIPLETVHHVRDTCLCLSMQRGARVLARRFDLALKPTGINNGQFSLLMALNQPQPPGVAQIAGLLGMDRTTMTAALKTLERRGLVNVVPDDKDRRARRIVITKQGTDVLRAALPIWQAEHDKLGKSLPPHGAERLRALAAAL